MVKKFISGILGKKEEGKAEGKEEVPDELPPLAEDIAKTAEQKPEEKKESTPAKEQPKDEVPEELPPLEEIPAPVKAHEGEAGTLEDLEKENIPDEIRKAKLAKAKPVVKALDTKEEIQKSKEDYSVSERIKAGAEVGFFSNLIEHVKKHDAAKERLLSGDLFSRMGNYWEIRKHEIKAGTQLPAEKKLEGDLIAKLDELKTLEQKWQVQKLALESDLRYIHERERDMQSKIEELKMISSELNLFRNVKPEEYFYLRNGVVLKNLHDLIDILEVIDDGTFNFHARGNKNDFSDWMRNVFKDNILADKIKNAKSKMEMIEILEKMPTGDDLEKASYTKLNPKKYFWLANGAVIRNLYELSDALRVMDDDLFSKHANVSKNDFAAWVKNVFRNEHLAEKLSNAKTKKEMIEILEVFL